MLQLRRIGAVTNIGAKCVTPPASAQASANSLATCARRQLRPGPLRVRTAHRTARILKPATSAWALLTLRRFFTSSLQFALPHATSVLSEHSTAAAPSILQTAPCLRRTTAGLDPAPRMAFSRTGPPARSLAIRTTCRVQRRHISASTGQLALLLSHAHGAAGRRAGMEINTPSIAAATPQRAPQATQTVGQFLIHLTHACARGPCTATDYLHLKTVNAATALPMDFSPTVQSAQPNV